MREILELLGNMDYLYLVLILCAGRILSNDQIINPLPLWLKGILLRITVAWRVLIISLAIGIGLYYFRKYNFTDNHDEIQSLALTYFVANGFYELFAKALFTIVENFISNWWKSRTYRG